MPSAHRLEGALHPDRAEIDVGEDERDEQHADHAVEDLGQLHVADAHAVIEREHQHVAGNDHRRAAEHDEPVEQLLAGVELVRGRFDVALAHAAAGLEPFDVGRGREVLPDPNQEHQHHADGEGEAEIVMRVLCPFRPGAEGLRTHPRQQQRTAEGDVEAGDAENDEGRGGQPMHETLEGVETHHGAAGAAALDLHGAAPQIEDDEQRQHAEDGDAADPLQRDGVKGLPVRGPPDGSGWPPSCPECSRHRG